MIHPAWSRENMVPSAVSHENMTHSAFMSVATDVVVLSLGYDSKNMTNFVVGLIVYVSYIVKCVRKPAISCLCR